MADQMLLMRRYMYNILKRKNPDIAFVDCQHFLLNALLLNENYLLCN